LFCFLQEVESLVLDLRKDVYTADLLAERLIAMVTVRLVAHESLFSNLTYIDQYLVLKTSDRQLDHCFQTLTFSRESWLVFSRETG